MHVYKLILLLSLVGCTSFKNRSQISPKDRWLMSWHQACSNSEGKGQLFINKKTYSFSYESLLNTSEKFWALALDVPLRGEETLIVSFDDKQTFGGSLFEGIDDKTRQKITDKVFFAWKRSWVNLLNFIQARDAWAKKNWSENLCLKTEKCQGKEGDISWKYTEDSIILSIKSDDQSNLEWQFKKTSDEIFYNQQLVTLRHQKTLQTISLHLYPTTCRK